MNKRQALLFIMLLNLFFLVPISASAAGSQYDEAIEYISIKPPVSVHSAGKVEVVELFWYGCPHCFRFEPLFEEWVKHQDKSKVEIIKLPAIFRPGWIPGAKAYYTAKLLGISDKIHQALFDGVHLQHQRPDDEKYYQKVFAKHGIDEATFKNTYNSFAVDALVRKAQDLSRRYQVDGVPAMVVNGKYRTSGTIAHGHEGMLKVVDFLIQKESRK